MSDRERQRREQQRRDSFSIQEWCKHRRLSRAMFYLLDQRGLAPRTYYVGARRFISDEADAAWLTAREADAAA
jgi:Zn-dependent peptidase ImmA (M78 family)